MCCNPATPSVTSSTMASSWSSTGSPAASVASRAREDDESLGRSGHRDVAVHGPLDALAERVGFDEDHQVELEALRQLGCQRADARARPERVAVEVADADDTGDAVRVPGEPRVEDRGQVRHAAVGDGDAGAAD